jgi:hypothetical protein
MQQESESLPSNPTNFLEYKGVSLLTEWLFPALLDSRAINNFIKLSDGQKLKSADFIQLRKSG